MNVKFYNPLSLEIFGSVTMNLTTISPSIPNDFNSGGKITFYFIADEIFQPWKRYFFSIKKGRKDHIWIYNFQLKFHNFTFFFLKFNYSFLSITLWYCCAKNEIKSINYAQHINHLEKLLTFLASFVFN